MTLAAGSVVPAVPFDLLIAPVGVAPLVTNSEIARVTAMTGLAVTAMTRGMYGTSARTILVGDQCFNGVTKEVILAIEAAITAETVRATTAEGLLATSVALSAEATARANADALLATLASPALTGTPTAPTQAAGNNSTRLATTAYADGAVATEATARSTADALKAPLASPALTGTPTAPTATALDASTKLATTAYADGAVAVETSARGTAVGAEATTRAAADALLAKGLTPTATKTANYTAAAGDFVVADSSGGTFTITLPSAPADKTRIAIKKVDASATAITFATSGSDVFNKAGGSTTGSLLISSQGYEFQYQAAGAIWFILNTALPLTGLDARYDAAGLAAAEAVTRAAADSLLAPIASPTFTGSPRVPTAAANDSSTLIADTAYVTAALLAGVGGRISTMTASYGLVLDAKTLTDAAITTGQATLSSASASFSAGDIGKTIVVCQAGAPAVTGTSSSLLSTGAPITTLPCNALAQAMPACAFTITSGANTQTFKTIGAISGATTIPVTSQTPNFAYPSGSVIATLPQPLKTTIQSVQSSTGITLAATATTTVTGGELVYGTNNLTGLQQAINDAITHNTTLHIASDSTGEGYLIDGLPVVNGHLNITGNGCHEMFGAASGGLNGDNFPVTAPYFKGSVLIQAAQNTDGLQNTGIATSNSYTGFGVRFAGKFNATGHGFNCQPPITSSTFRDSGMLAGTWTGVKVFGHDGNHYGFKFTNCMYQTYIDLHSYGGGGIMPEQNSNLCTYGNATYVHPYAVVIATGAAHGFVPTTTATAGTGLNKILIIAPQVWTQIPSPAVAGAAGAQASQSNYTSVGNVTNINVIAPDMETNSGSSVSWALGGNGTGQIMGGQSNLVLPEQVAGNSWNQLGSQSALQNDRGTTIIYSIAVDLCPTVNHGADATILTAAASGMSSPVTAAEESVPAGSVPTLTTLSVATGVGSVSSLTVVALPAALPARSFFYLQTGTTETLCQVSAAGAAQGATSIPLQSNISGTNFPIGANIVPGVRRTLTTWITPSRWMQLVYTNAAQYLGAAGAKALGVAGSSP